MNFIFEQMLQIGENIKLIRGLAGKTQPEFAIIIGEKLSNLKTYETKDIPPKLHVQHKIAKIAGVSLEDLQGKKLTPDDIEINLKVEKVKNVNSGTQEPQNSTNGTQDNKNYMEERRAKKGISVPYMVPLVPVKAQAGYATSYDSIEFINTLEMYPILHGIDHRGADWRYFEVKGDSMENTLFENEVILVSMVPPEDWNDIKGNQVYVIVVGDDVLVKIVIPVDKETWILASSNKRVRQKKINVSDVKELWQFRGKTTRRLEIPKIQIKV